MIVYILHIDHKHGDDYWAFSDEEKAKNRILLWVRERWSIDLGTEIPVDLDDGGIIIEYFERVVEVQWTIYDVTLDQD